MNFCPINVNDFKIISEWWNQADIVFVDKPDNVWLNYVTNSENVLCEKYSNTKEILGYYQLDIENQNSFLSIVVNPSYYRSGIGTKLIQKAIFESNARKCNYIQANIDTNNHISIALFKKLKFKMQNDSNDSQYHYRLIL